MSQPNLPDRVALALERIERGTAIDPDSRRNPRAARYHRAARSESTRRVYLHFIKQWLQFCMLMGRREAPAHAAGLEDFMIWLAETQPRKGKNREKGQGMAPNTLKLALSAVGAFHDAMGERMPSTRMALRIIEGHANERSDAGMHDGEGVPPIKLPTLLQLINACPTDTNAGIRDRAMLASGFSVMARRSELAYIDCGGLTFDDDGYLRVFIKKTKVGKKGRTAVVMPWPDYPEQCPVAAMRRYATRLQGLGLWGEDLPLFRAVDKWDRVNGHQLWAGNRSAGIRMDPVTVERCIARAAAAAMLPDWEKLKPHGLRAGGATTAWEYGADILSIARQGGWADRSPVVFRYIRDIDLVIRNPMRDVGKKRRKAAA